MSSPAAPASNKKQCKRNSDEVVDVDDDRRIPCLLSFYTDYEGKVEGYLLRESALPLSLKDLQRQMEMRDNSRMLYTAGSFTPVKRTPGRGQDTSKLVSMQDMLTHFEVRDGVVIDATAGFATPAEYRVDLIRVQEGQQDE